MALNSSNLFRIVSCFEQSTILYSSNTTTLLSAPLISVRSSFCFVVILKSCFEYLYIVFTNTILTFFLSGSVISLKYSSLIMMSGIRISITFLKVTVFLVLVFASLSNAYSVPSNISFASSFLPPPRAPESLLNKIGGAPSIVPYS